MAARKNVSRARAVTMRREIEIGLAQLRRGEGIDGETFFRRLEARRRAKRVRRQ